MRMAISLILLFLALASPLAAGYDDDRNEAMQLVAAGRHAEALALLVKLSESATDDARKSDVLHQAALCASRLKQHDRATELAARIPMASMSNAARMQVLSLAGKWRELLDTFKDEDIARWPKGLQGDAFRARGTAYHQAKDGRGAEADLKQAAAASPWERDRILALGTLAETYRTVLKDEPKALATYLEIHRRAGENDRWGWSYLAATTSAADILTAQGKFAEALALLAKVDVASLSGYWRSAVLTACGATYAAQGRSTDAMTKYSEAAEVPGLQPSQKAAIENKIKDLLATLAAKGSATELLLVVGGKSDYQIVLPDKYPDAEIETWLTRTAQLIRAALAANGAEVHVVACGNRDASRPGLYLGDTEFARSKGIRLAALSEWSYRHKVVGRDVVIAGRDRPCPIAPPQGGWPSRVQGRPELGTVKAALDFLRQYAGTRFLYPGETGIEFLRRPVSGVPKDLDVVKTPTVRFNFSHFQRDDPYYVANNFLFPVNRGYHNWEGAIPAATYRDAHPEYFALVNGQRCCLTKDWTGRWAEQYCLSNPDVRELIYQALRTQADRGFDVVSVNHPDGFMKCQCDECKRLYDTGDDWCEKVWIFYRELALRLQKERPGRNVDFYSYGPTYDPPKTFQSFPENTSVMLCHTTAESFASWNRCRVPGGFTAYLYDWGTYHRQAYAPKRTRQYVAEQVRRFHENHVGGVLIDGFGESFGLDGFAYYVYGRTFDDPARLDAKILSEEFCTAAFREAAVPMARFFDELDHALAAGDRVEGYHEVPLGNRRPILDDPLHYLGFTYTPDRLAAMESHLRTAQRLAVSEKVERRLALVRREFDVLKSNLTVVRFYDAYRMRPDAMSREGLLRAIDDRNALLDSYYTGKASGSRWIPGNMKPIPGWREVLPFAGHGRANVGLGLDTNLAKYKGSVFGWDTWAVRKSPLPAADRPDDSSSRGGPQ